MFCYIFSSSEEHVFFLYFSVKSSSSESEGEEDSGIFTKIKEKATDVFDWSKKQKHTKKKIYKHTSKTREKAANVFDWSLKNKNKQDTN